MTQPKLLVTRRWPASVESKIAVRFDADFNSADSPLSSEQLRDALQKYDAILPTVTDRIDATVLNVPDIRAKIIANYGVGYSNIDTAIAIRKEIAVTNTPDVLSACTADLAMTLLLMIARRAGEGERELRTGSWTGWRPTHMMGTKVSGSVLGIVGFGRIGQAMAHRARFGFGMRILVHNRTPVPNDVLASFDAQQFTSIDELLPKCDFVSLHCPGGDSNRHLINAQRLRLLKPDAFLVNTARGEVVDEQALADALTHKCIGGAALDVYEQEPRVNQDLLAAENVVLLPHLGSATRETREAMGLRVLDNVSEFFAGRRPKDLIV